jgi:hypothetical protein
MKSGSRGRRMKKKIRDWLVIPFIIVFVIGGLFVLNLIILQPIPSEPEYTHDRNSLEMTAGTNDRRYAVNESIQIRIAMHNRNRSTLVLSFSTNLQVDYWILQNSTFLYAMSGDWIYENWVTYIEIPPEDMIHATLLHCSSRFPLTPGDYEICAFVVGYQNVTMSIQVHNFTTEVTTDKIEYQLGDSIQINLEVFNPTNSTMVLNFGTPVHFLYSIVGINASRPYYWTTFYYHFDIGLFFPVASSGSIPPYSSGIHSWEYNLNENPLPPGSYVLFAWVIGYGGNETRISIV